MADILIHLEMPTQCGNCPISTNTRRCTILWREFGDPSKRLEDCPLIPLPEGHGDLIDRDALLNEGADISDGYDVGGFCEATEWGYSTKMIENAPTIVPAEGGTDNG